MLRLIENSLSDGVLYVFRDPKGIEHDFDSMESVLAEFFRAVRDVWPEAWELPPKKSRLTHGAGIAALGHLMDSIAHRVGLRTPPTREQFASDLRAMRDVCHWTDGYWDLGPGRQRRWDELQNTSKDIDALVRYLAVHYKSILLYEHQGRRD
ncbi:MAG TPA: DNA sulfur modification protein DndB, partial [Tepidiformaceae bacterium]|nr:DNA sulfur modification protein DndB [Tepidiformaceae bacterium]